jgi:hypothetical protein
MERASLINRINYETRWLSRADLVRVGYRAVRRLFELKAEYGQLPAGIVESTLRKIDDALEWIDIVHEIDCIADTASRERELSRVGAEILARNEAMFFSGVANQAFPVNRAIGGRWFDELLHDGSIYEGQRSQHEAIASARAGG